MNQRQVFSLNLKRWFGATALAVVGWSLVVHAQDGSTFASADWPFIGGDWTNSRYSTLDQINTDTVSDLGAVWSMRFEGGATTRATPIIKDGIMYIGSGTRLHAINAATGERLWTIRPDQDAPTSLETAGIGDILNAGRAMPSPPGVGVGDGRVFVGLMDAGGGRQPGDRGVSVGDPDRLHPGPNGSGRLRRTDLRKRRRLHRSGQRRLGIPRQGRGA